MKSRVSITTLMFLLLSLQALSVVIPPVVSDFNDLTTQGWTMELPFGGTLFVDNKGGDTPDGFLVATDDTSGGHLYVRAPSSQIDVDIASTFNVQGGYTGNFLVYAGIQWDEFIYDNGDKTVRTTSIHVVGEDGTRYRTRQALELGIVGVWTTRFFAFDDPINWTRLEGTGSLSDVLQNVQSLFISMDTSTQTEGARESGVDNIMLVPTFVVPEPSMIAFSAVGGLILLKITKRKRL